MKTANPLPDIQPPPLHCAPPRSSRPPDIKDWCLTQADAWYQQEDQGLARTFLQFALDIDPRDTQAWIALGSLHFISGDYGSALRAFTRAHKSDPQNPAVQLHLALTHQQREEWAEAEAFFKRALQFQPANIGALKLYSGYLMFRQRPAEARQLLERALGFDLDDIEIFQRLGVCCFQGGDFQAARACFNRVLQLDPSDPLARENLQTVSERAGRCISQS